MLRIIHTHCTLMAALSTLVMSSKGIVLNCYSTTASDYDGHQQITKFGKTCLRWDKFNENTSSGYPDAAISDAANFCRARQGYFTPWCYISESGHWEKCSIYKCGDDVLTKCGQLSIETPIILGRNVTFSFTPDIRDPNANLYWQRKSIGAETWLTLNLNYKFTQYQTSKTYHLVLTDNDKHDEQNYRVHYYNETMRCRMETKRLELKGNSCGLVQLRNEKVIRNWIVEIEYYPPNNVLANPGIFHRQWRHYSDQKNAQLQLVKGRYEEKLEKSDTYVLTMYLFNDDMNGEYGVFCGNDLGCTNLVNVEITEPPSLPIILGLQEIEKCTNCIVGEDKEMFIVSCEIIEGTRPLHVTMTIGNETYTPRLFNSTTYMAFFILRRRVHMESVSFSIMNDAVSSPLKATAQVFVIKNREKQNNIVQASNKLVIWIILGSSLLLVGIFVVVVLFVVIRKRRQNPKDKASEKRPIEQSSDVDKKQEHFGHSSKSKDSDEHVFGNTQHTDPDHLSLERINVYDKIRMH